MSIERFECIEARIEGLEERMTELSGISPRIKKLEETLDVRLASIENFVGGYNTVAGLTKKHWKTVLTFGAGLMSAAGIGNPKVTEFITAFFGA